MAVVKPPVIDVFELATNRVVESIPCKSEHQAEKALRGLLRQIDDARYGAAIRSLAATEKQGESNG